MRDGRTECRIRDFSAHLNPTNETLASPLQKVKIVYIRSFPSPAIVLAYGSKDG